MPYLGVKPADITSATEAEIAGDLTVDTNTLHVDASGNKVGIGTASPDTIADIAGSGVPLEIDSTNSNTYKVQFKNNGTVTSYLGTTSNAFYFGNSSAAQLARLDSDGLKFGTDSAAANALGDYEEGTFTPSFTQGASSVTYSTQSGHYVKVGKLVHIAIYLDAASTSGTTSNVVVISGLPYATAVFPPLSSFTIGYSNNFNPTGNPLTALGNSNNTTINLYEFDGTNLLGTETNFLHDLYISGSYVAY